jgi:hypothetical protein
MDEIDYYSSALPCLTGYNWVLNNPNVFTDPDGNFTTSIYNSSTTIDVSVGSFNNGFTNVSYAAAAYSVDYYDFSGQSGGEYRRRASDVETGRIFNYKGDPNNVKVLYDDYWEWVPGEGSVNSVSMLSGRNGINAIYAVAAPLMGASTTGYSDFLLSGGEYRGVSGNYYSIAGRQGWNQFTGPKSHMNKVVNSARIASTANVGIGVINYGLIGYQRSTGQINNVQFAIETVSNSISTFAPAHIAIAWTIGYEGLGRNGIARMKWYQDWKASLRVGGRDGLLSTEW